MIIDKENLKHEIGNCIVFEDENNQGELYLYKVVEPNIQGCSFGLKQISRIREGIDTYIVADYSLPLRLPDVERYEPSGDGRSPLANLPDWTHVRLASNLSGERETNTMPQWGGSCWYYLRFMDPKNSQAIASPEALKYWGKTSQK